MRTYYDYLVYRAVGDDQHLFFLQSMPSFYLLFLVRSSSDYCSLYDLDVFQCRVPFWFPAPALWFFLLSFSNIHWSFCFCYSHNLYVFIVIYVILVHLMVYLYPSYHRLLYHFCLPTLGNRSIINDVLVISCLYNSFLVLKDNNCINHHLIHLIQGS